MSAVTQRVSLEPKSMVASYRISHSLASGGMAEVFEAEHAVLPRRVALKVMHPELLRKPDMDTRFLREACILESFTHPGGVRVFECGVLPDGRPWMAMELVRGHAMSQDMHTPMNPALVVSILASVMEVLAAAHAVGLIHRDLKPDNLLLADEADEYPVRVIDWGLARLHTFKRLTQDGTAAGTPLYMSPEQTQGKPLDGRCDVYSLGVVAYEALAGFPPFDGQNLVEIVVRQVTTEPQPLHQLRPDIPREVSDLVTAMLTRDPAQRPTAADLIPRLRALQELMGPSPAAAESGEVDAEEPILEYSFEREAGEALALIDTAAMVELPKVSSVPVTPVSNPIPEVPGSIADSIAASFAAAEQSMRALEEATVLTSAPDDLDLEIDVELSDVSDVEDAKTLPQGMPKVVVDLADENHAAAERAYAANAALEASARAALEAVAMMEASAPLREAVMPLRAPLPSEPTAVLRSNVPLNQVSDTIVLDHPLMPAAAQASAQTGKATPARIAPRHPPSEPIVLKQKLQRAPSEPLRVRPAATPQSEPSVQTVAPARDEAGPGMRMHWTPEPVRLDALGITARRRHRCEITPRGPSDQVAGELNVAASLGRRSR